MAKFLVELHKPCARHGYPFNPFLGRIHPDDKVEMHICEYEIEAENTDEVMELLQEAFDQDLYTVRGYTLRSIKEINE